MHGLAEKRPERPCVIDQGPRCHGADEASHYFGTCDRSRQLGTNGCGRGPYWRRLVYGVVPPVRLNPGTDSCMRLLPVEVGVSASCTGLYHDEAPAFMPGSLIPGHSRQPYQGTAAPASASCLPRNAQVNLAPRRTCLQRGQVGLPALGTWFGSEGAVSRSLVGSPTPPSRSTSPPWRRRMRTASSTRSVVFTVTRDRPDSTCS